MFTQTVDKKVVNVRGDRDVSNSTFGLLRLKGATATNSSIKVKWNKVNGAKCYVVYGNKCGHKYKRLRIVNGGSYTQSKLKKGTYYKYMGVALNGQNKPIAYSKTIHVMTNGGKKVNPNGVKVTSSKKLKLKVKKSSRIKAKYTVAKNKKTSVHRALSYESSNSKVASVSKNGKITAKYKGYCTIYIYAQNGAYNEVQVSVR